MIIKLYIETGFERLMDCILLHYCIKFVAGILVFIKTDKRLILTSRYHTYAVKAYATVFSLKS